MNSGQNLKLLATVSYACLVGGFALLAAHNWGANAPPVRLARDVEADEPLTDSDLRSEEQSLVVNKYARAKMAKGSEVHPWDVVDARTIPPARFVAFVPMPLRANQKPVLPGDAVRLCLGATNVLDKIEVLSATCDSAACLVGVPLASVPKELSQQAATALTVFPSSVPCKN